MDYGDKNVNIWNFHFVRPVQTGPPVSNFTWRRPFAEEGSQPWWTTVMDRWQIDDIGPLLQIYQLAFKTLKADLEVTWLLILHYKTTTNL